MYTHIGKRRKKNRKRRDAKEREKEKQKRKRGYGGREEMARVTEKWRGNWG